MATRPSAKKPRPPAPPQPPADPLADMVRAAGLGDPARTALVQALAHQLVEDHYAKLDQAGHTEDEGIPLRRVFIDLYAADQASDERASKKGLVAQLLAMQPMRLGGDASGEEPSVPVSPGGIAGSFSYGGVKGPLPRGGVKGCAGFVLIGGPGQGKSTLGQLACQAHRAALLLAYQSLLTARERSVLADFTDPDALKELGAPAYPSLPVRIVLPDAAGWIVEQQQKDAKAADDPQRLPWLLRFWRSRLPETARAALRPADLLALLRAGPFLLVLDGLDEVPAAGARQRVLSAVRDLGSALGGARGLLIATTRPQGYAGELDGLGVELRTRYLAELTPERALAYAARLVNERIADRSDAEKVLGRMREASTEAATRRLMTTPLQVTILAALLRKGGRPPRERWSLFARYYDVMYQRELAKPTDTAELLNTYKEHVYKIHARAGLLLQVESESSERTDASLSRERLEAIVDAVLSEEGFQGSQRPALIEQIVAAAAQRLVFLVQPQEGKFGFEIRSLQEFMAAAALAQKSEAMTRARLAHVARAGSFRNVTLFLTGKLLADGSDLRDAIAREVCPALERDPLGKAAAAGAVLALDILEDGAVLSQPRRAEDLLRVALGILDVAPSALQVRLAHLLLGDETPARATLEPLLRDGIQSRLSREPASARLGAWMALLPLLAGERGGPAWALAVAEQAWPKSPEEQRAIVETALAVADEHERGPHTLSPWLVERVGASLEHFHWSTIEQLVRPWYGLREAVKRDAPIWWLLKSLRSFHRLQVPITFGKRQYGPFSVISVLPAEKLHHHLPPLPEVPSWQAFAAVMAFAARPSAAAMALALRAIAAHAAEDRRSIHYHVPWPLAALLRMVSSVDELRALADRAAAGHFGDMALWQQAEEQWSKGVELDDLLATFTRDPLSWPATELLRAPPFESLSTLLLTDLPKAEQARAVRFWLSELPAAPAQTKALAMHLAYGSGPVLERVIAETPAEMIAALVQEMKTCGAGMLAVLIDSRAMTPAALDQWGRGRPSLQLWEEEEDLSAAMALAAMYTSNPALQGLLHLIVPLAEQGGVASIPAPLLERDRFEEPLLRADAWRLRISAGAVRSDEVATLLQDIHAAAEREPRWLSRLASAVEFGALEAPVRDALLVAIHSSSEVSAASDALRIMLELLQSRTSGLEDPETWTALELPLPLPRSSAQTALPAAGPDLAGPPVHLHKLTLQNVRSLEHLPLELTTPPADEGQWVVLLGENGAGKSTALRAIVLALRNLSDPKIWPNGALTPAWRRIGSNPETDACRVIVRLGNGIDYETTIHPNGKEVFTQSPPRSPSAPAPCLLWAYGCRRGSALGGTSREVDASDDGPDIATLFDERASLIHAQTWLQKLDGEASRDKTGATRAIYNTVIGALKKILAVDEIDFDSDSNVIVTGDNVGTRVPLAALSDGYLTTAGWMLDLLARWISRAKQAGLSIGPDFPERMTGLVLLDEIDLHLHPAWQLEAIPRVRAIFKRLSFVITTHNPLTIVGARPEEIWILQRDANGVRAEQKPDIPATLTAAQIYGRFFGIEGYFPNALGQKLQRYGFLCGNPYRSDEEQREMEALRADLAKANVAHGWHEQPRATIPSASKPKAKAKPKAKPRSRKSTAS